MAVTAVSGPLGRKLEEADGDVGAYGSDADG
jgi:hypothetical protein